MAAGPVPRREIRGRLCYNQGMEADVQAEHQANTDDPIEIMVRWLRTEAADIMRMGDANHKVIFNISPGRVRAVIERHTELVQ